MIKAIQTKYNGYHFRSRLEARWAVFFDTLKIPYQYELEGFDLGIAWYLPDFYLSEWGIWIEIKPTLPMDDIVEQDGELILILHKNDLRPTEIVKFFVLQQEWNKAKNKSKAHYICYGTPGVPKIEINGAKWKILDGSIAINPIQLEGNMLLPVNAFAMVDGKKELDIWPYYMDKKYLSPEIIEQHNNHSKYLYANPVFPEQFIPRLYEGKGVAYDTPNLLTAYEKARSYRFE